MQLKQILEIFNTRLYNIIMLYEEYDHPVGDLKICGIYPF